MEIPIIKLEVQGMKKTIMHALTQHAAMMDEDIKDAVDRVCTSEYVSNLVAEVTQKEMTDAIERQIKYFYSYGEGYELIRQAVTTMFKKDEEEK